MKVLYIAPENVVGNLNLWQQVHESRGNECRYITYFQSQFGFPDDICLNLPMVAPNKWFLELRELVYKKSGGPHPEIELEGYPPIYQSGNWAIKYFFQYRDLLWRLWVEPAIKKYDLLNFDIIHLETGLEFYRNGSFVKRLAKSGKPIFNTFHGIELRHRGVIPEIERFVKLHFTSELDLLPKHPNLKYLFLPFDVDNFQPEYKLHDPITICHATRHRYFKGSDQIIEVCRGLEKKLGIHFLLIENQSHEQTLKMKKEADIYIDQVANIAPGYGMNSIEAMSLGTVCCTNIDEDYCAFLPDHPFVHITPEILETELTKLVQTPEDILEKGRQARIWVERHHSLKAVGDQLYSYYREAGINR